MYLRIFISTINAPTSNGKRSGSIVRDEKIARDGVKNSAHRGEIYILGEYLDDTSFLSRITYVPSEIQTCVHKKVL